jgi:hypothetical protein
MCALSYSSSFCPLLGYVASHDLFRCDASFGWNGVHDNFPLLVPSRTMMGGSEGAGNAGKYETWCHDFLIWRVRRNSAALWRDNCVSEFLVCFLFSRSFSSFFFCSVSSLWGIMCTYALETIHYDGINGTEGRNAWLPGHKIFQTNLN